MSAISNFLNQIKTAIYGEQVRDAIHDSILQCYTDVTNAKTIADNSNYTAQQSIQQANDAVDAANAAQRTADNAIADVTAARDTAVQAKDDAVNAKNTANTLATQVANDKDAIIAIQEHVTQLEQSASDSAENAAASEEAASDSAQRADDIRVTIEEMLQTSEFELSDRAKLAFLECFKHVAWVDSDGLEYYNELSSALEPPVADYIRAEFDAGGNTVYTSDTLDSLRKYLTVKVFYTNGKQAYTRGYTLSGRLTSGNSTITVEYSGKTTSFVVAVTALTVSSVTCVYQQSGTVYDTDTLDVLKSDLTVTAHFTNNTEQVLDSLNYELSGTLTEGESVITVSYGGKTTTFTVQVSVYVSDVLYELTTPVTLDGNSVNNVVNTGVHISDSDETCSIFIEFTAANTSAWHFLFHCMDDNQPWAGYSFCPTDSSGTLRFMDNVAEYWFSPIGSTTAIARFAYTHDKSAGTRYAKLSVDGNERTMTNYIARNPSTSQIPVNKPLTLGGVISNDLTEFGAVWKGTISKAKVFNRACVTSEINAFLSTGELP